MDVSDQAIAEAVERVLGGAENREAESFRQAESLLEEVARREPARLASFLGPLFDKPNHWDLAWAWRAANEATVAELLTIRSGSDRTRGDTAELLLTHTCRRDVIERMLACDGASGRHLNRVGLERVQGAAPGKMLRALTTPEPWHIVFPPGDPSPCPDWRDADHPTWQGYNTSAATCRFGGTLTVRCELCGDVLDHLITLDPVPRSFGFSPRTTRIELGCCLSCVFEENGTGGSFFRHDENGSILPQAIDPEIIDAPEFPSEPFIEQSVCLIPAAPEWQVQRGGNLNQVGGLPEWVQHARYVPCNDCGVTMSFLLQLDSNLPTVDGERYLWANGGMAYASWCDGCRISHVFLQYS